MHDVARDAARSGPTKFNLARDALASVVVFLVALPLCMGIALASGVPVSAGLITGIVGGIIVGVLASSNMQVSGPAAGLTVVVLGYVQNPQIGLERLGLVVLVAGAIQLLAGILRLGQWFRAVSPAVIQGMLAGIGVLIFSSQFHVMVDDSPKENGIKNLATIPDAIRKGFPWPTLGSEEERQFRTDHLQGIGALHEQQVQVAEGVAELLPDPTIPDPVDVPRESLASLTERQAGITTQLDKLLNDLTRDRLPSLTDQQFSRLQVAVAVAHDRSGAALKDLQQGELAKARKTQTESVQSMESLLNRLKNHDWAAKLGLLTIAIIVLWPMLMPRKLRLVPAPLVAVSLVAIFAGVLCLPVLYVEVPESLWSEVHLPVVAVLQTAPWGIILQAALVMALIASAETLLCAAAVDQLHDGPRTHFDRELGAQGIGNIICGSLGALPMTAVIVRSAANVQAGATSRLSSILHGLWLLLFVLFLGSLLKMIPTASLAAILVYTGYKLVNPKAFKQLWATDRGEAAIFLVTVPMIVATDILTGVLTGIGLSAVKLLVTFSRLSARLEEEPEQNTVTLRLEGAATFIRLPLLAATLERVAAGAELHVDVEQLDYIDHACLEMLKNWEKQHESTGGKLMIDWGTLHARHRDVNGHPHPATNGNGHSTDSDQITLQISQKK